MSFQTSIRPAESVDIADIRRVARTTWHTVYDDILGAETVEAHLKEGYAPPLLEQMIELEEVGLFVSTADDDVVAYMSCGMTDATGFGDLDLYVHPDYWEKVSGRNCYTAANSTCTSSPCGRSATKCWPRTRSGTCSTARTSRRSASGRPRSVERNTQSTCTSGDCKRRVNVRLGARVTHTLS